MTPAALWPHGDPLGVPLCMNPLQSSLRQDGKAKFMTITGAFPLETVTKEVTLCDGRGQGHVVGYVHSCWQSASYGFSRGPVRDRHTNSFPEPDSSEFVKKVLQHGNSQDCFSTFFSILVNPPN